MNCNCVCKQKRTPVKNERVIAQHFLDKEIPKLNQIDRERISRNKIHVINDIVTYKIRLKREDYSLKSVINTIDILE